MQEAISIFSHILDKDFFESLYRTSLAKRLMNTESKGTSILQDAEKEMIKYLKKDIGASYTQRLEVMLADVESSIDQMTNFKDSALIKSIKCEFQAKVLTAGSWPRFNRDEAAKSSTQSIPPEIQSCMDSFQTYYLSKFQSNRKITWSLDHGTAEVHFIAPADKKRYRVTMSTRQCCVVNMFNSTSTAST